MVRLRLAVFNTQPPHLYFGGVERRIIETARRTRYEVQSTIYSGTKAGFRRPVVVDGVAIVPCFSTDNLFPVDNWFFNRSLVKAANSIRADVFESHTVSGYGFQRALRKRNIRQPFIQTVHGVLADEYLQASRDSSLTFRDRLANLLLLRLSRLEADSARIADLVVTVSQESLRKLIQLYGIDKSKIRVVPNGVDPERFKPRNDGEKFKCRFRLSKKKVVLFVGRLIPRKGLSHLIRAAEIIVKTRGETVFLIAGDGPLKNRLLTELKHSGLLENFVFLGDVSEKLLPFLYNCADVFVLPSIQEGQGIALLEAQASGKPVVAFNVGGVREALRDNETGFTVDVGSQNLAGALLKLLSDDSLREKMGRKGREYVSSSLSWDVCAKKMVQVYEEAMSFN